MLPAAELERLAAQRRHLVKDTPQAIVEVLGDGQDAVVCKTYRNRGVRWLQTFCRRSRAHREHDHLAAVAAAGVPGLAPVGWAERRRLLGVDESTLVTRFLPGASPLKQVLRDAPPRQRARLAHAAGALVAQLHHRGIVWGTPMPRNVLVLGDPGLASLAVCDTPLCIVLDHDLHAGRLARIDLFLAAFSPSRRRDWSRPERLRWLLGYTAGDRPLARRLWRTMVRRRPLQNVVERALAIAWLTHILGPLRRPRRPRTDPAR